jgi:hypothetical protein
MMKTRQYHQITCGLLIVLVITLSGTPTVAKTSDITPIQYLAFQVFTGSPSPNIPIGGSGAQPLSPPPSKAAMKQLVQDIVDQVGSTGDPHHKLAFIVGPLAFDHTDAQLQQMVRDAFEIAVELNIAVGFHIDDSMFWARRSDLWHDPKNVEWLDWESTPNTGRRIDWGPQPTKFAPQMCFNSAAIQTEVTRLANQVIGRAIQQEVSKLIAQGRPELFAGVIVGWETQIGQDFDTNQFLGYCALSNLGFSRANPPQNLDTELEKVVQTFIERWASGIKQAEIDPAKIYSHTALLPQSVFDTMHISDTSYSKFNHFAPPEVSFGANYRPGFSTYPQTGLMEQLYATFLKHGNPGWASSEGSIVNPATLESVVKPETYLGWMFNHNAALVNIFGWGVGTQGENPFFKAAAGSESLDAYRKFLSGRPLIEDTTDLTSNVSGNLPDKIHEIQADLPTWLPKHPDQQSKIQLLLTQLDQDVKAGNYQDAATTADTILSLIGQ